jgi:hypothetical protein
MAVSSLSTPAAPPALTEAEINRFIHAMSRTGFFYPLIKAAVDRIARDPESLAELRDLVRRTSA